MNKKNNRQIHLSGFRMPLDLFCEKYGIDLKLVRHRTNILYWPDLDALVMPAQAGDMMPAVAKKVLYLSEQLHWSDAEISERFDVTEEQINAILHSSVYLKEQLKNVEHCWLDPNTFNPDEYFLSNRE